MLSAAARETGTWLVGGSIPEIVQGNAEGGPKYYNTCTVFNPAGELVVTHRKVHLFDIDIPGQITFKVSCEYFYQVLRLLNNIL